MGGARHAPGGLEAFWDLERFFAKASNAQLGLPEVEREAERRGRELVRLCLQAHLDGRGDGDLGAALALDGPDGPVRLTHKRVHTRRLLTVFGPVTVSRVGYGARGGPSIHPLDAELALPRSYSYEISRRLIRAAVCGPFDEATALVAEMTGVNVPKRSAEQIVREAAGDFEAFYAGQGRGAGQGLAAGEILVGAMTARASRW